MPLPNHPATAGNENTDAALSRQEVRVVGANTQSGENPMSSSQTTADAVFVCGRCEQPLNADHHWTDSKGRCRCTDGGNALRRQVPQPIPDGQRIELIAALLRTIGGHIDQIGDTPATTGWISASRLHLAHAAGSVDGLRTAIDAEAAL